MVRLACWRRQATKPNSRIKPKLTTNLKIMNSVKPKQAIRNIVIGFFSLSPSDNAANVVKISIITPNMTRLAGIMKSALGNATVTVLVPPTYCLRRHLD